MSLILIKNFIQNHWFTYNEKITVESLTQAVSNLALAFGDDDADPGAMVTSTAIDLVYSIVLIYIHVHVTFWLFRAVPLVLLCCLLVSMTKDHNCKP